MGRASESACFLASQRAVGGAAGGIRVLASKAARVPAWSGSGIAEALAPLRRKRAVHDSAFSSPLAKGSQLAESSRSGTQRGERIKISARVQRKCKVVILLEERGFAEGLLPRAVYLYQTDISSLKTIKTQNKAFLFVFLFNFIIQLAQTTHCTTTQEGT